MGSGKMQCWINGPVADGIDDKIKMAYILIKFFVLEQHIISALNLTN
jgi:hypothetical protein